MHDPITGTSVTPLALVTDFPVPKDAVPGLAVVLVQVRITAGDEYDSPVYARVVSLTDHDANLDWVMLGGGNPDTLTPAMSAAGYEPLQTVEAGETETGWIGAWLDEEYTDFDLVYNREEGTVIGGSKSGEKVKGYREIVQLTPQ